MLLRDRISAGSITSRKPRLPMSEYQRSKPRSRASSKAEIKVEDQPASPPLPSDSAASVSSPTRPPPFAKLAAIYLPVSDLKVSREFYRDLLGLRIVPHNAGEEAAGESGGVRLNFGKGREMEIKLHQSDYSRGKGKGKVPNLADMRPQYSLAVSTKEETRRWEEWLRKKGVEVTIAKGQEEQSSSLLIRDPDGNVGKIVCEGDGEDR